MYKKSKENLLIDYVNQSILNYSLQSEIIQNQVSSSSLAEDNLKNSIVKNPGIQESKEGQKKLDTFINAVGAKDFFQGLQTINNSTTKVEILLKSFCISYFSIFEIFIRDLSVHLKIDSSQDLEGIIKEINEKLNINIRKICGEGIYKGFLEFKKRRNIFIHYGDTISSEYLDYINRHNLLEELRTIGLMDKLESNLTLGNKLLCTPNYFLIRHFQIDTIGIVIGMLVFNKILTKKEFYKQIDLVEDYLIYNKQIHFIRSFFLILEKHIKFKNSTLLKVLYSIIFLEKTFKNNKSTVSEKKIKKEYLYILSKIDIKSLNFYEKIKFYGLIENFQEVNKLLQSEFFNETTVYYILGRKELDLYFEKNNKILASIIWDKKVSIQTQYDMTFEAGEKFKILLSIIGNL